MQKCLFCLCFTRPISCLDICCTAHNNISCLTVMNSLKVAADALKKSPKLMRKKFEKIAGKHEPLEEDKDLKSIRENLPDGITFFVKKLGSLQVPVGQGTGCTEDSVNELVRMTKKSKAKSNKALQKLSMTVTPEMLRLKDIETKDIVEDIPLYRMSYCTADQQYPKVFAFIARPGGSRDLYCHAFLTHKSSMAEAIALTISEAFAMSFESWETTLNRRKSAIEEQCEEDAIELYGDLGKNSESSNPVHTEVQINVPAESSVAADGKNDEVWKEENQSRSQEDSASLDDKEPKNYMAYIFQSLQKTEIRDEEDGKDDFQRLAEERSKVTILDEDVRKSSLKAKGVCFDDFLSVKEEDLNLSVSMEDLGEITE